MSWDPIHSVRRVGVVVALAAFLCPPAYGQDGSDPAQLLVEAERLAWLKVWTKAEPLYAAAERAFAARGDKRNALYAQINALRGQLPRLPVPEVSERLANYLEDPLVLIDDRLRLRTLIIKGPARHHRSGGATPLRSLARHPGLLTYTSATDKRQTIRGGSRRSRVASGEQERRSRERICHEQPANLMDLG